LSVTVSGVRSMGPIVIFTGRITKGDLLVCEAKMKVFKEYEQ
jgi:hypothetical protein